MADKKLKLQQQLAKKLGRGKFMAERVGHKKVIFTPIKNQAKTFVCLPCNQRFENIDERNAHEKEFHLRKRKNKQGVAQEELMYCKFCWQRFYYTNDLVHHLHNSDHLAEEIFPNKFTQIFNNPAPTTNGASHPMYKCLLCPQTAIPRLIVDIEAHLRSEHHMYAQTPLSPEYYERVEEAQLPQSLPSHLDDTDHDSGLSQEGNMMPPTPPSSPPPTPTEESPPEPKRRRVAVKSLKKLPDTATLTQRQDVIEHVDDNGKILYECKKCNKMLSSMTLLDLHMKRQHVEKVVKPSFYCALCRDEFHSYTDLNAHYTMHHLDVNEDMCVTKLKSCRVCSKVCKTQISGRYHEHEKHEDLFREGDSSTEFTIRCSFCTMELPCLLHMYSHEVHNHRQLMQLLCYPPDVVKLITAFNCKICNQNFRTKEILMVHQEKCS